MGRNLMGAASEMVDLIKKIIREEEEKKDQIITATVLTRNDANDTYDVYIDSELSPTGRQALMKGMPNESKHVYRPGDHVYVMKVRGQVAQGFIIGSIGNMGVSINAKVADLSKELGDLSANASPAMMLVAPTMKAEAVDLDGTFGIRVSWAGGTIPNSVSSVYTDLTIGGSQYPNGYITLYWYPANYASHYTGTIRVFAASGVFSGVTTAKITIHSASIKPGNETQQFTLAFTNSGSPILYSDVTVNGLKTGDGRGYSIMGSDYDFTVTPS